MALVKIRMNTWDRKGTRSTKFKRNIAPREGFVEFDKTSKSVILKAGSSKWKNWDTTISRKNDASYIADRKNMYSGLCFTTKNEAKTFMNKHKAELDKIAANNPLFDHWSIMNIISRFQPENAVIYGKDVTED